MQCCISSGNEQCHPRIVSSFIHTSGGACRQGEAAYVADMLTAMVEGGALEDARDIFAVIICRGCVNIALNYQDYHHLHCVYQLKTLAIFKS